MNLNDTLTLLVLAHKQVENHLKEYDARILSQYNLIKNLEDQIKTLEAELVYAPKKRKRNV